MINIYKNGAIPDFDNFLIYYQGQLFEQCCEVSNRRSPFIKKLLTKKVYSKVHNFSDTICIILCGGSVGWTFVLKIVQ